METKIEPHVKSEWYMGLQSRVYLHGAFACIVTVGDSGVLESAHVPLNTHLANGLTVIDAVESGQLRIRWDATLYFAIEPMPVTQLLSSMNTDTKYGAIENHNPTNNTSTP